jgi:hypothetical protein
MRAASLAGGTRNNGMNVRRVLAWFVTGFAIALLSAVLAALLERSSPLQIVPLILANLLAPAYLYAIELLAVPHWSQYPLAAVANGVVYSGLGAAGALIPSRPRALRAAAYIGVLIGWSVYVVSFRQ